MSETAQCTLVQGLAIWSQEARGSLSVAPESHFGGQGRPGQPLGVPRSWEWGESGGQKGFHPGKDAGKIANFKTRTLKKSRPGCAVTQKGLCQMNKQDL